MDAEKIIQTIRKVLELSRNNPSQEEAKAAALKAQQLLAKYHIDIAEVEEIEPEEIYQAKVKLPTRKWKYILANIVADNFRCRYFYYGSQAVVFYGHKTDADVAAATFKFLFDMGHKSAASIAQKYFRETGSSSGIYNNYVHGFCNGLKEALDKQCTALMLVVPQDVNDEFESMISKGSFREIQRSPMRSRHDEDVYRKGYAAGKSAMDSRELAG